MILKHGVKISGIRPELVLALFMAERVYANHGERLTITSVLDGEHMMASLHYIGCAADLRRPATHFREIADHIRDNLGVEFDVVLNTDHIHIEFQPKDAQGRHGG